MKKLIVILFLIGFSGMAQVKGNKEIETRTFEIENLELLKVNFYANIIVDNSAEEGMSITTKANAK